MNSGRKAIAVIGEGITEKYYIESLKGLTQFQVTPKELNKKALSLIKLEQNIKLSISAYYDEVYCLIDMDSKNRPSSLAEYKKLKDKYHNKIHGAKKNGIQCKVIFIESERCIELWFLYHFLKTVTTKKFDTYNALERELKKHLPNYEKREKYFRSVNLHKELTKINSKGALKSAVDNAKKSVLIKERDGRNHTYTELHILIQALGIKTD